MQRQFINTSPVRQLNRTTVTVDYWSHWHVITMLLSGTRVVKYCPLWLKKSVLSLQQYIPDITPYRYAIAKQHALLHDRGCPLPKPMQKRMRAPPEMVDHFISCITSQHIIQELPFGQKTLALSSGKVFIVPYVIRNMIPERIVQQYQAYCKESNITS